MSEEFYTVEMAAERLRLHAKTVLRFIRDGRLRATRIGKSYRILRSDLEAFGGASPRRGPPVPTAQVTSIIDIPGIGREAAIRMANRVVAVVGSREAHPAPVRVDTAYDPEREHLKIVMFGSPGDTAELIRLVQAWLEA
ncbi:helix-turn-helix domain-containing protein [Archangium lipolyticum]|uniref:helix-turn-helix domain-containing protein n=1 Tax=Archangium lipolyticum TaxID=2970465 RepID=UPI00214A522F|nr:helix-turn-helix domain-containing protein [Archangium lipolyticum]